MTKPETTLKAWRLGWNEPVDEVKQLVGGTATVFSGDTRVATNVMKDDGTRAVGTKLARNAAYDAVLVRGEPYRGQADILGKPFFTAYDPIKNKAGETIGVLYVGLPKDSLIADLHELEAKLGVAVALVTLIGFLQRKLTFAELWAALRETGIQTTSIFFIAAAAKIFVAFIALTGVAPEIVNAVTNAEPNVIVLMFAIAAIYLALGMFLDPIGIMVLTLPLMVPLVESYGLDLIWFGVVVIKLLEIGLITPPVGLNVFVISSVVGKEVPIDRIFSGILRFLTIDILVLIIIMAVPMLSLIIPQSM